MSYYMRFLSTDAAPIECEELSNAFTSTTNKYDVQVDDSAATIAFEGALLAHVEINTPGDGLFDEERDELIDFVREAPDGAGKMRVLTTLESLTSIVAVQVLFGTGDSETTLARLDPLWAWLFDNRAGLLQADGEGYYHRGQLLLKA